MAARWLTGGERVATLTIKMWHVSGDRRRRSRIASLQTLNWFYALCAIGKQVGSLLLVTTPRFFFYQSIITNIFWLLPWAIAFTKLQLEAADERRALTLHAALFGGALTLSFIVTSAAAVIWTLRLKKRLIREIVA